MAGRGPAPQAQHQRERDTKRRQDGGTTIVPDNRSRGPALPKGYQPETEAWYAELRKSPQAQTFLPIDWQHLQMVARIVDRWVLGGYRAMDWQEVRLNLANYGLTPADRMRLKMKVQTPESAPEKETEAGVTSITARRRNVAARLAQGQGAS